MARASIPRTHSLDDRGATAVEYGLLVAFLAAVIAVGVALVGGQVGAGMASAAEALGTASANPTSTSGDEASPEAGAQEQPAEAKGTYDGPTPKSNYAADLGDSGSFALPSIAGIQYATAGCSKSKNDGCDSDKIRFTATALAGDTEWGQEKRQATMRIVWTIPESATTNQASGSFTVRLT